MTLTELQEHVKKLKYLLGTCNLIKVYHKTALKYREFALDVIKNNDVWEVYYIDERGSKELSCVFETEGDAYEYVYCFFKKMSDSQRLFGGWTRYPQLIEVMERHKIQKTEYSFNGGMPDNCLCVEQKEDVWEVYYSDGIEKENRGIFYNANDAYDFLFYLVMSKHVNVKKCWW